MSQGLSELLVECRHDPRCGSVPVRFGRPGRMHEVADVLDHWEGEEERYFRVLLADSSTYILRLGIPDGRWLIHFYDAGGSRPS